METNKFNSNILKIVSKRDAIFMCFHPMNKDAYKYIELERSLPRIDGLKRKSNRMKFVYDIIQQMDKNGISLVKK